MEEVDKLLKAGANPSSYDKVYFYTEFLLYRLKNSPSVPYNLSSYCYYSDHYIAWPIIYCI